MFPQRPDPEPQRRFLSSKRHREDELSRVEGCRLLLSSHPFSAPNAVSLSPGPHPLVSGKATNSNNKGWLYRVIKALYMNPEVEGREDVTAEEDGTAAARPRRRKRVDYLAVVSAGRALKHARGSTHARTHARTALHARHTFPSRGRRFVMMRRVSTIDDIKPRAGLQPALLEKKTFSPLARPLAQQHWLLAFPTGLPLARPDRGTRRDPG